METTRQSVVQQKNEISLKDLILKIQEWWRYLLSKWIIILIFGLVGAGLGLTYALLQKPVYIGKLTFVVEGTKSNPFSSYAGLASQFGLDLGSTSESGVFEGDNIIEFLQSRLIVEKTLLSPITVDGKVISLADYYLMVNGFREKWIGKPALAKLALPVNGNRQAFTLLQDSIMNMIQETIVKKELEVEKPNKTQNFISVITASDDEKFSKAFTEQLVKEATNFYIETKTKRNKINVDRLQAQADSLKALLNRKTYSVAVTQDLNLNPARQAANVNTEVAMRDKIVLQTMYGEIVRNLELSKIAMTQETPIIQVIDTPILPLKKKSFGKLKGLVLGGFLGGLLVVMFLLAQQIYKDIMQL